MRQKKTQFRVVFVRSSYEFSSDNSAWGRFTRENPTDRPNISQKSVIIHRGAQLGSSLFQCTTKLHRKIAYHSTADG